MSRSLAEILLGDNHLVREGNLVHEVNPEGKKVATTNPDGSVTVLIPGEWNWSRADSLSSRPLGKGERSVGRVIGRSPQALGEFFSEQSFVGVDREGCGGSGVVFDSQGRPVHYEHDGRGSTTAKFLDGTTRTYGIDGEMGVSEAPRKKFLGIF